MVDHQCLPRVRLSREKTGRCFECDTWFPAGSIAATTTVTRQDNGKTYTIFLCHSCEEDELKDGPDGTCCAACDGIVKGKFTTIEENLDE